MSEAATVSGDGVRSDRPQETEAATAVAAIRNVIRGLRSVSGVIMSPAGKGGWRLLPARRGIARERPHALDDGLELWIGIGPESDHCPRPARGGGPVGRAGGEVGA